MIGLMFAVSLTNVPDALLLLRLHEIGISATGVVFGYIIYNLVAAVLALPAGVLSDKVGRDRVYVMGLAVFTISYIGLGSTDSPVISFLLMALYGCFPAFTDGVGKAWVTGLATAANRGKAQGAFRMWQTFGILLAGTWAGLTWNLGDGHGGLSLILAGILCAVGGTVVFRARSTLRL